MDRNKLAEPPRPSQRGWVRIEDYFGALARRRTERRKREPKTRRTEPEEPRLLLSTLPFVTLIAALVVLVAGIAWLAWPGREQPHPRQQAAEREPGTAPSGWFEEARKDFRR